MKKIAVLLFIFALTAVAFHAQAVEKNQLNESQVKRGVFKMFQSLAKVDGYDLKNITADSIVILQKTPIQWDSMTFFAVKIKVPEIPGAKGKLPPKISFVTDQSGTLQFDNIRKLESGRSITSAALKMMESPTETKKEKKAPVKPVRIPPDFGTTFFNGSGKHEVILVSDPFCPFCGKAYLYLMKNKRRIKKINLAHFPLASHPGATLTAWAIKHAEKKGLGPRLIDFAYTSLKPTKKEMGKSLDEVRMALAAKIIRKFPELSDGMKPRVFYNHLKNLYGDKVKKEKDLLIKFGVTSVPFIIIDGDLIRGFQPSEMDDLLE